MSDDVEDLLERASHVRPRPIDPAEIWATGTRRRRTRRTIQTATTMLVVLALATPVAITAYRDLSTPGVDVADSPSTDAREPSTPLEACDVAEPGDGVTVNRAEAAAVIAAVLDDASAQIPASPPDRFVDDDDSEHEQAINDLSALNVLQGTGRAPERFAPNDPLTRGQLASLLVRSYEFTTGDRLDAPADAFADDDGSPHEADNAKAAATGLLPAVRSGQFDPYATVTREEIDEARHRLERLLSGDAVPRCDP